VSKAIRIVLIVLVALLVLAIVGVFVANSRYEFLFDAPRVSHETLITPGTSMRLAVQPPLAKPLLLKMLGDQAPPGWIIDRVMPYEAAVIAAPDVHAKHFEVTLFLNARRASPYIMEMTKTLRIREKAPFLDWDGDGFTRVQPGVLAIKGTTAIDDGTAAAVTDHWGVVTIPTRPALEGSHLAELSVDNRDGSLFAMLMLFANKGLIELPLRSEDLRDTLAPIATMHLAGDLAGDDDMTILLTVDCQPTAEEGEITAVSFALGGIIGELTKVAQTKGATLSGSKKLNGATISGVYTLGGVSKLFGI